MFIIEVIPLAILPNNVPQLLSYFHDVQLEKGAMVEVMIGRRNIKAIVVSCTSLEQQKGSLKKSMFQLKKISKVISQEPKVSEIQFKILLWLSRHYYTPLGLSLKTVFPSFLFTKKYSIKKNEVSKKLSKPELIILSTEDTIKKIHSLIKKVTGQVLIIVPDRIVLDYFQASFIKYNPIIVHSGQNDSQKFKNWLAVQNGAKVIIGTRLALFFSFNDLETIIIEDSLNEMYKSDMTPKYIAPDLAEKVARIYGANLYFLSSFAGVINYFKFQKNLLNLSEIAPKSLLNIKIINTVNELRAGNFTLLSRELKEELLTTIEKGKKVLIFSPRKGYSGFLLCQNCGISVKCPNCSVPMRVHKSIELILVCHRCVHTQPFPKFCSNCNSYKLKTAGPGGSQKIYDELRELLLENKLKSTLLILDSDVIKNETEIEEVMSEIKKPGSAVLIASQMVFSHRYDIDFNIVGVINGDALLAMPDYNSEERTIYQIKKLQDFKPNKLLIQTYSSDNSIYNTLISNDYTDFYKQEVETRKIFNYPPFCRLIKLTYCHTDEGRALIAARVLVEKLKMAAAQEKLNDKITILDASPAYVAKEKGYYMYNVILKIWPDMLNLKDILKYVTLGWSIEADPKTVL